MEEAVFARSLAAELLTEVLPSRWSHVRAVAATSGDVAASLALDRSLLVSAGWLHDIGYAPEAVVTGFHPLDGARFLRARGVDEAVVAMVARHSFAPVEAGLRGLLGELNGEFPEQDRALADALCYADMTTGPDGSRVDVEERLVEIRARYGPGDVVTTFVDAAGPEIVATVRRIEEKLKVAAQSR